MTNLDKIIRAVIVIIAVGASMGVTAHFIIKHW